MMEYLVGSALQTHGVLIPREIVPLSFTTVTSSRFAVVALSPSLAILRILRYPFRTDEIRFRVRTTPEAEGGSKQISRTRFRRSMEKVGERVSYSPLSQLSHLFCRFSHKKNFYPSPISQRFCIPRSMLD